MTTLPVLDEASLHQVRITFYWCPRRTDHVQVKERVLSSSKTEVVACCFRHHGCRVVNVMTDTDILDDPYCLIGKHKYTVLRNARWNRWHRPTPRLGYHRQPIYK